MITKTKDFPQIVGKIEITKNYLGSKEEFLKQLDFQLEALKTDMISAWKKQYGKSDN